MNTLTIPELAFLPVAQLRLHPSNARRFYPPDGVAEMAASIQEQGILQALLVVPASALSQSDRALAETDGPLDDLYFVVDGNLRLSAARTLPHCPPLKCEIIPADRAQQLLVMAATSEMHYPKDAISMALHYQRLRNEEGMSVAAIARRVGKSHSHVTGTISLLDLEPAIQALVASGALPRDRSMRDALMGIPDTAARVQLAQRLAQSGASRRAIVTACKALATRLREAENHRASRIPALLYATQQAPRAPNGQQPVPWETVREAAAATCGPCDVRRVRLPDAPEPAWALVVEASEATCGACTVRDLEDACRACPQVELLARLMRAVRSA